MAGFALGALSWSASGKVTTFSGRVLGAFSSGRGGTDGESAYDSVAGGDVTFAAGGPVRGAAGGAEGELSGETTG